MYVTVLARSCTVFRLVRWLRTCAVLQKYDRRCFSVFVTNMSGAQIVLLAHHRQFFYASCYRYPISAKMQFCTLPHCTYRSSSMFNLQHHMARYPVRQEGLSACDVTVVCEVQVEVRCNCRVSKALYSAPGQNLYSSVNRMVQSKEIHCVLFLIAQFSPRRFLDVIQSARLGKLSSCFTEITSTWIYLETKWRAGHRAVRCCKKTPVKCLKTKEV